jgi:hypothetical protein
MQDEILHYFCPFNTGQALNGAEKPVSAGATLPDGFSLWQS